MSTRDQTRAVNVPVPPDIPRPLNSGDRILVAGSNGSSGPQQTFDNPLLTFDDTVARPGSGKTELEEYVLEFTRRNDLEDRYELLIFGARLGRDKDAAMIQYDRELTTPEKKLLIEEKAKHTGFWRQSKFFKATIITASLAGMIQGWTQSINNGTGSGMPEEFDLWIFGMLNAIPLISAGLFGTTLSDPLQEYYLGRRGSVLVSALLTVASTIGASTTHSVGQLAACRAINGIALGAKASIVPIYSAEISPEHIRGAILANWQLADAAGIFLGFVANLIIVSYVDDSSKGWRILTNTVLIPTIPLMILLYLMPESPRYLMKHGRYRKALEAFQIIQTTPLLASRDLMYAHAQLDFESRLLKGTVSEQATLADRIERRNTNPPHTVDGVRSDRCSSLSVSILSTHDRAQDVGPSLKKAIRPMESNQQASLVRGAELPVIEKRGSDLSSLDAESAGQSNGQKNNPYLYHIGVTGYSKRLMELWRNKRCRRALLSACVAMISQQMTGLNVIAFLGTTVWENSLGTSSSAKTNAIIGLVFGAANYLGGLPAYWLSDKYGRSILLAFGLPNMAWSMLVFALLFQLPEGVTRTSLVSLFAVIFTLFYAPTAGTSPFAISAEVFPLVSREVGMAVSVAVNLLGASILVLVLPMLLHRIGTTASLLIFVGLNLVAFMLVYLFVPETRRRTLEELQYTFDLSTRLHVEYRAVYIRKFFFANVWKFMRGKKVRPPVPFYRWARRTHGDDREG